MSHIKLKKLLFDRAASDPVIAFLQAFDSSLAIQDASGAWLLGTSSENADKFSIQSGEDVLGWVVGAQAKSVATFLSYLASKESEKVALADEVLDKYREINLLFNLSEKLGASLDLDVITQTIFNEASRLIKASTGEIILFSEAGTVQHACSFGSLANGSNARPWDAVAARAVSTGKGEIVNAEPSVLPDQQGAVSFLYAPIKTKQRVTGVVILVGESIVSYRANDLKLLNTVAAQSAPQIENALLYEKTLREAREREEHLQKQIEELRIQIDESRLTRQVAEITETEYFQMLRNRADRLRHDLARVDTRP